MDIPKKVRVLLLLLVYIELALAYQCEPFEAISNRHGNFPKCTTYRLDINNTCTIKCLDFDDSTCEMSYVYQPERKIILNCEESKNSRKCLDMVLKFPHIKEVSIFEYVHCSLPMETSLINDTRRTSAVLFPALTMKSTSSPFNSKIEKLSLIRSKVNMSKDFFQHLQNIQEFQLIKNDIQHFDFAAFEELPNLKILKLDFYHGINPEKNQHIENFHVKIFKKYDVLEKLEIASAPEVFKNLSPSFFHNFPLLSELKLPGNLIEVLGDDSCFENKQHLEKLDLSYNNLSNIPYKCFENLPQLKTLGLNDQRSSLKITKNLFENLKNLRDLDLSFSDVKNIPDESFVNNNRLETLDLSGNALTNFTENSLLGLYELKSLTIRSQKTRLMLPNAFLKSITKLETLDLSWNAIESLPKDFLANNIALKSLNLAGNRFSKLPREVFKNVSGLKELFLNDQKQKVEIASGLFDDLSKLVDLDLSSNRIQFLPDQVFVNQNLLYKLDLSANDLSNLSMKMFHHGLHELRVLNVHSQHVPEVIVSERCFENLKKLERLDLSFNDIKMLPKNIFSNNTSLKYLNLAGNRFKTLPETLFKSLTALENLLMHYSKGHIPIPKKLFKNMGMLKTVDLSWSGITSLPEGLFSNNTILTSLDLSGNSITNITENFLSGASSLESLIIHYQKGNVTIPSGLFDDLERIKTIDLSGNHIKTIPDKLFYKNRALKDLNLRDNQLTNITEGTFAGLSNLTVLNLEFNDLFKIDRRAFTDLVNLEVAKLSANNLVFNSSFSYSPFYKNYNIRKLYLSDNSITQIYGDWRNARKLIYLDLDSNSISQLNSHSIKFASRSIVVNLMHNPIKTFYLDNVIPSSPKAYLKNIEIHLKSDDFICDCYMFNFMRYIRNQVTLPIKSNISFTLNNSTCSGPEGMAQKDILSIDLDWCTKPSVQTTMEPPKPEEKTTNDTWISSMQLYLILELLTILGMIYLVYVGSTNYYMLRKKKGYSLI